MTSINQLPLLTDPSSNDSILAQSVSSGITGRVTIGQIINVITSGVANPVTSTAIALAGGILDDQFSGLGYVKKTGTQAFVEVCVIPASDITDLGILATTSTQASAKTYLGITAFGSQLTSAAAAVNVRTLLGFTTYGASLVSAANAAAAGTLLNLGTLATVSTAASGATFLNLGTLATTSTAASGRSFLGLAAVAATGTLGSLNDVSSVSPGTGTYLGYNGTQWVPSSVASGGAVDASSVAAAGAVMDGDFVGASGYMRKLSAGTYDVTTGIPATAITNLGVLATTSTAASASTFLGLGALATTSTAASARTFIGATTFGTAMLTAATTNAGQAVLGMTTFGTSLVSSANAAAAGTLLNLGTLATTSTAASGRTFLGLGTLALQNTTGVSVSYIQTPSLDLGGVGPTQVKGKPYLGFYVSAGPSAYNQFSIESVSGTSPFLTVNFMGTPLGYFSTSGFTNLGTNGVVAGTYTNPQITVDAGGLVTQISSGAGGSNPMRGFAAMTKSGGARTNVSVGNGVVTLVATSTVFDPTSSYSSVSSKFTPKTAGYYNFMVRTGYRCDTTAATILNGAGISLALYKNNATANLNTSFSLETVSGANLTGFTNGILFMNGTTDQVKAKIVAVGTGSAVVSSSNVYFSGHYVGS